MMTVVKKHLISYLNISYLVSHFYHKEQDKACHDKMQS